MRRIKYLVMDVDGTLTDGKIYIGENGELFKAFDVKDGYGIGVLLPKYGITPVIITARESIMLVNRCEELGITEIYQAESDKLSCIETILNREKGKIETVAYIGDDIPDLKCMRPINEAGGLVGCPSDAVEEVKLYSHYICKKKGGNGAVREFIEWIIESNYANLIGDIL